jgi:hypothetical protein
MFLDSETGQDLTRLLAELEQVMVLGKLLLALRLNLLEVLVSKLMWLLEGMAAPSASKLGSRG